MTVHLAFYGMMLDKPGMDSNWFPLCDCDINEWSTDTDKVKGGLDKTITGQKELGNNCLT